MLPVCLRSLNFSFGISKSLSPCEIPFCHAFPHLVPSTKFCCVDLFFCRVPKSTGNGSASLPTAVHPARPTPRITGGSLVSVVPPPSVWVGVPQLKLHFCLLFPMPASVSLAAVYTPRGLAYRTRSARPWRFSCCGYGDLYSKGTGRMPLINVLAKSNTSYLFFTT